VIAEVRERYAPYLVGEKVNYFESALHRETAAKMEPGDYLHELREGAGWTLRKVGEAVGVAEQRVHDWETGYRAISKDRAKRLGEVFGVSPAVFI